MPAYKAFFTAFSSASLKNIRKFDNYIDNFDFPIIESYSSSYATDVLSALKVAQGEFMVAKVIAVFNQKGGCGKTTVSMQLAGTLGLRGNRVLVIDMDEQVTATRWASHATDVKPFPATLSNLAMMGGKMHREVRSQIENYDFIVIDCPPAVHSPSPSSAMLVADLSLIPVVPAPADMWAVVAAKQLASQAQATNEGLKIRLVPNMVQKNTTLARDTLGVLAEDDEIPLLKAWLGSRSAYRECQLMGATVHQVSRAKDAISEVDALVDEVLELVNH